MNIALKEISVFLIRYYWLIRKRILTFLGLKEITEAIRNGTIRRILVTRFQSMGDMMVFIPFLRELRKFFPDSHISVLANKKLGIETLDGCPYINEIIQYKCEKSLLKRWIEIMHLRKKKFDLFIVSSAEADLAYVGVFTGVKYMIGFDRKIRFSEVRAKEDQRLLDVCVKFDPYQSELLQNLKLLSSLDFKNIKDNVEYWIYESDKLYVRKLLYNGLGISSDTLLVGIHPGSNQQTKRWTPIKFAQLADLLIENFGARVLLVGSQDEIRLSMQISVLMKNNPIILNGKTTIRQLAALMSELRLFICNDSGPMHLASALGLPVVALFGPGEINQWNCYGSANNVVIIRHKVDCSPCYKMTCQNHKCMKLISVTEVYEAIKKLVGGSQFNNINKSKVTG